MESTLKQMFGGGQFDSDEKTKQAKDFVSRYEQGDPAEGFSKEEALEHYKQVAQHASPETMQRATKQAVDKLDPKQREAFSKMLQDRQSGQVQRQVDQESGGQGGGLDDILGSILGGGGGASTDPAVVEGGGGGGGIGDLLGGNIGKAILGGVAAFAMKEILDNK